MTPDIHQSQADSRLKHCRFYDGQNEPFLTEPFEEYYFAMAEKFYVHGDSGEDEQYYLDLVKSLPLDDLRGDVPTELVAYLYLTCDHVMHKSAWDSCPQEEVTDYFLTKYFPQYLTSRNPQ